MNTFNTIITIINTLAASLACLFAFITVLQTKRELKESKKSNIKITLVILRHEDICIHLENIGGSSAENVKLFFSGNLLDKLRDFKKDQFTKLYKDGFTLNPGQSIYYSLGHIVEFRKITNEKLKVSVEYFDIFNKNPQKPNNVITEIDFSGFNGSMIYLSPEDDIAYTLNEIKDKMHYIVDPLEGIRISPIRILNNTRK